MMICLTPPHRAASRPGGDSGHYVSGTIGSEHFSSLVAMSGEEKIVSSGPPPSSSSSSLLDLSRADKAVWLLKVPLRVAQSWQQQTDAGNPLAKLILTLDPTKSEEPEFSLELAASETAGIPKDYLLSVNKDLVPTHVFSENPQGKLSVEGKVERKFDMKPNTLVSDEYRKLCRERTDKSKLKTRTLQVLENDHGGYMRPQPVMIGPTYAAKRKPTVAKAPESKRIRIERGELEVMVFKLFEQQPYWTLKQLVNETQQPEAFLKEVMSELCIYNKRGPNQGKYELKPEFRMSTEEENPPE
ncbi:hypothetical protein GOP47_0019038 [Adiantum capillus-veneris]|uniref:Transcription initiation factor IIF subunit beta n=1 Tax=Adiantum capillus-veneris TaxID=13818 RepID=A0A9D4Z9B1_ADICA|nr:hypothetical protein GOP47_0019038 [Adiantum capillus-veneris]